MRIDFIVRAAIGCAFSLTFAQMRPQDMPTIPQSHDPRFWGRSGDPYILTFTQTTVRADTNELVSTVESSEYRDSSGRVANRAFYNSGKLMTVTIRDPNQNTTTILMTVPKTTRTVSTPPPIALPPERGGWSVERLQTRTIADLQAEGFRFTRPLAGTENSVKKLVVEEDWISTLHGLVLERTIDDPRGTRTTRTVTKFQQTEPDPSIFTVPEDYRPAVD